MNESKENRLALNYRRTSRELQLVATVPSVKGVVSYRDYLLHTRTSDDMLKLYMQMQDRLGNDGFAGNQAFSDETIFH